MNRVNTDEHLRAVGGIALEFARLEWLLDNVLVGVNCEFKSREEQPTGYDSVSKRLALIGYRVEKKYPDRLIDWQGLEREIRALAKQWNDVLNSVRAGHEDSNVSVVIAREAFREYSVEELLGLSNKTEAVNRRVAGFLASF